VVTFDEASSSVRQTITRSWRPNLVYTVLLGTPINPGTSSNAPYNHYSLLRTVETNFGLSPSLLPDGVNAIDGIWK
jgi:hypothetical protein